MRVDTSSSGSTGETPQPISSWQRALEPRRDERWSPCRPVATQADLDDLMTVEPGTLSSVSMLSWIQRAFNRCEHQRRNGQITPTHEGTEDQHGCGRTAKLRFGQFRVSDRRSSTDLVHQV